MKTLGFSENDSKEVLSGVVELVEERHLLPKLRKVKKKKRITQDLYKLHEQVIEEVLPNGVKKFPDAYITGFGQLKCKELSIPAVKVKLGENFFGTQQICDTDGNHIMDQPDEALAKYIIYAKKPDEQIVRVPENITIIKKAIQSYELDVKNIRNRLYTASMEKSGNHAVSSNIVNQICEEFGLPETH